MGLTYKVRNQRHGYKCFRSGGNIYTRAFTLGIWQQALKEAALMPLFLLPFIIKLVSAQYLY